MTRDQEMAMNKAVLLDMEYQRLLTKCTALEEAYQRIMTNLPPEERETVEKYIALCEEMDHRRICLAMEIRMDSLK